jgi:hypothetical protein
MGTWIGICKYDEQREGSIIMEENRAGLSAKLPDLYQKRIDSISEEEEKFIPLFHEYWILLNVNEVGILVRKEVLMLEKLKFYLKLYKKELKNLDKNKANYKQLSYRLKSLIECFKYCIKHDLMIYPHE